MAWRKSIKKTKRLNQAISAKTIKLAALTLALGHMDPKDTSRRETEREPDSLVSMPGGSVGGMELSDDINSFTCIHSYRRILKI